MPRPPSSGRTIAALLLPFLAAVGATQEHVTVRILDQAAQPIVGSQLFVDGFGAFATGTVATLPIGTHNAYVFPGLDGGAQLTHLFRQETITISAGQTALDFEWITTNVTVRLRDQHGVDIPGSTGIVEAIPGSYRPLPFTVLLPITDPTVYPTIGGAHAEGVGKGYDVQLIPGILGQPTGPTTLLRIPGSAPAAESVAVHAGTTELDFRWTTQTVTFRLHDQHGVDIPGSGMILLAAQSPPIRMLPFTATLPVTDLALYPDMAGSESEHPGYGFGYGINLLPGILGELAGGHLQREEGIATANAIELHVGTTNLDFEWITTQVTIDVKDQHGASFLAARWC